MQRLKLTGAARIHRSILWGARALHALVLAVILWPSPALQAQPCRGRHLSIQQQGAAGPRFSLWVRPSGDASFSCWNYPGFADGIYTGSIESLDTRLMTCLIADLNSLPVLPTSWCPSESNFGYSYLDVVNTADSSHSIRMIELPGLPYRALHARVEEALCRARWDSFLPHGSTPQRRR